MQKTLDQMKNDMEICNNMTCREEFRFRVLHKDRSVTLKDGIMSTDIVSITIEKDESLTHAISRLRQGILKNETWTKEKIEFARIKLARLEVDCMDNFKLFEIMLSGMTGFNNHTDEEIIEFFNDEFPNFDWSTV